MELNIDKTKWGINGIVGVGGIIHSDQQDNDLVVLFLNWKPSPLVKLNLLTYYIVCILLRMSRIKEAC